MRRKFQALVDEYHGFKYRHLDYIHQFFEEQRTMRREERRSRDRVGTYRKSGDDGRSEATSRHQEALPSSEEPQEGIDSDIETELEDVISEDEMDDQRRVVAD